MAEAATSSPNLESIQALPRVNPANQLIANGKEQILTLSDGDQKGGVTDLNMQSLSPILSRENDDFKVGGQPADLMAIIAAGQQRIGIIDLNKDEGYESEDYNYDNSRFAVAQLQEEQTEDGQITYSIKNDADGYQIVQPMHEPETAHRIGRKKQSPGTESINQNMSTDLTLSAHHADYFFTRYGTLRVRDRNSTTGTHIIVKPAFNPEDPDKGLDYLETSASKRSIYGKAAGIKLTGQVVIIDNNNLDRPDLQTGLNSEHSVKPGPEYDNARKVTPDELIRVPGNGGKPVSEKYIANQTAAREYLVNLMASGELYQSADSFKQAMQQAHRLAAADNVYQDVGDGDKIVDETNAGVLRSPDSNMYNTRVKGARRVVNVADRYGDRYAGRFRPAKPGTVTESKVELDRINKQFWPNDTIIAGDNGQVDDKTYEFHYPNADGLDEYFGAMADIGKIIDQGIKQPVPNKTKVLGLIAEQYQYGAVARPFDQINNSLFMNLANAQIKILGFDGITHGEMDHIAHRIQTPAFRRYFVNRVVGTEA